MFDNIIAPDGDNGYSIVTYPGGSTAIIVEMTTRNIITKTQVKAIAHAFGVSFEWPIPNVGHHTNLPYNIGDRIKLAITLYFNESIPPTVFDLNLVVTDQNQEAIGGGRFTIDILDLSNY